MNTWSRESHNKLKSLITFLPTEIEYLEQKITKQASLSVQHNVQHIVQHSVQHDHIHHGLHSGYDPNDHDNLIHQSLNPGFDPGQGHDD